MASKTLRCHQQRYTNKIQVGGFRQVLQKITQKLHCTYRVQHMDSPESTDLIRKFRSHNTIACRFTVVSAKVGLPAAVCST